MELHYNLFDCSANNLRVKFINGEAKFYENATQILTNNPSLDYQLSNLNNFANLKNYNHHYPMEVRRGDRLFQMTIVPRYTGEYTEVSSFSKVSKRGSKAFGERSGV